MLETCVQMRLLSKRNDDTELMAIDMCIDAKDALAHLLDQLLEAPRERNTELRWKLGLVFDIVAKPSQDTFNVLCSW